MKNKSFDQPTRKPKKRRHSRMDPYKRDSKKDFLNENY